MAFFCRCTFVLIQQYSQNCGNIRAVYGIICFPFFSKYLKYFIWTVINPAQRKAITPEVFFKKGVLRTFAKFAGKHLCQISFLIKFQA